MTFFLSWRADVWKRYSSLDRYDTDRRIVFHAAVTFAILCGCLLAWVSLVVIPSQTSPEPVTITSDSGPVYGWGEGYAFGVRDATGETVKVDGRGWKRGDRLTGWPASASTLDSENDGYAVFQDHAPVHWPAFYGFLLSGLLFGVGVLCLVRWVFVSAYVRVQRSRNVVNAAFL